MEKRQGSTEVPNKRINNSIRAAALCLGVSPETVLMHIDFLRNADELLKRSQEHLHEAEKLNKDVKKAIL
jgi:predicted ArsR family transcriptional regulator